MSPMQDGSLPGRGRCVQVRGAVEPSPGAGARDSWVWDGGRAEMGKKEEGGKEGVEEMGRPGNRLPPCMGESSGEETLLTWRVFVCVLLPF